MELIIVSLIMVHELKDNQQVAAYTCYNSFKIEIPYKFDYNHIFFLEYLRNAYFLVVWGNFTKDS
jgi:hypothetical protein